MMLAGLVLAATAGANSLKSITATGLPGNRVQLELHLTGPAPQTLTFSVNSPPYISIDLLHTKLKINHERQTVGIGAVRNISLAQAQGRTRVVLALKSVQPYQVLHKGHALFIIVGQSSSARQTFGPVSQTTASTAPTPAQPPTPAITDIRFSRSTDGAGQVKVDLNSKSIVGSVHQVGDRVTVTFPGTHLPGRLEKRYIVTEFATPITEFTAQQIGHMTRLTIDGHGNFAQLAFQSNHLFSVELRPLSPLQQRLQARTMFVGAPLTLNFQSIPVRAVLQILADFSGLNMVVANDVHGHITLRLHDVPWDQALHIILETEGLGMRKQGNVVMIAPIAQLASQEQQEAASIKQMQILAPLHTDYIVINYAQAGALASLIQQQKQLLGTRGSVTVDPRTNTLIIRDTNAHLEEVRRLVHTLDIPVRQVLISSRIVVATNRFSRNLGTQLGLVGVRQTGNDSLISVTGDAQGNNTIQQSALTNYNTTGQFQPVTFPALADQLAINNPATTPVGTLAVGILNSNYLINLELSALQSEGLGEVVSSPRVITADEQKATIEQGVEIPYQEAASSGATAIAFKKAVLRLEVTPQITPDHRIIMQLEVRNDTVGQEVPTGTGGFVPAIDTRSVKTQVLVNNGDTVVLGGIYETNRTRTISKVPLLGDIPLIGWLFRNSAITNNKDQLIVFVTPKILNQALTH
ncbi:type IV pilus biogenesis protein PilQ [mine drainage metagenome]|uniref:Type IV pilus biogenesis protein PilQ n=2 Tax=mine drainage metagenome TaxID=410659 RepID=T1BIG3_9ZZZZ